MRFAGAVSWRLFLVRSVLGLLMGLYLFVVIASHLVPLSSALEIPLGVAGWLAAVAIVVLFARRDNYLDFDVSDMRWRWIPHLAFAAAAAVAFYFAAAGNLSLGTCPRDATSCLKVDKWSTSDGRYYRQYPYDSQGNDDRNAPTVEISRPEYIAEVGTRLRSSAEFGIGALCFAWLASCALSGAIRED